MEKKEVKAEMKNSIQIGGIVATNLIVDLVKKLNYLMVRLPDDEALKVTFNSEGEDITIYLDNLTKFTSLKSIFNSKELL